MKRYNHKTAEKKWQKFWDEHKLYEARDFKGEKYYVLIEFPYPSGDGLHVGHVRSYSALDAVARWKRMQGKNVLYPIGFDAFGLPTENFAIKNKIHPRIATDRNIKTFTKQLKALGISFDWSRVVDTTEPEYYKWTQWIFLQLYKKGLAYRDEIAINWCPKCKTGLANEEVVNGKHERCGTPVEKKLMKQWVIRITKYADRLIEDLKLVDYPERVKTQQINWIGRSEGAVIDFPLDQKRNYVLLHGYNGTSKDIFFPWLKKSLEERGYGVTVPALPHPNKPTEEEQVDYVLKHVKLDKNTILFGHSLGAVVAMKVAEKLDVKIAGLVLAGGFTVPHFLDHKRNYEDQFVWKFDFEKIKSAAGYVKIFSSLNDYAVPVEQGRILARELSGELVEAETAEPHFTALKEPVLLDNLVPSVKVFTTRPDTLFGATYVVVAPEHALVSSMLGMQKSSLVNAKEVEAYVEESKKKTDIARTAEEKEKTGVELKGVCVIHPITGDKLPVWTADYVLTGYGTGAIMAVPAHDDRDFTFAKKYKLPIRQVIAPHVVDAVNPPKSGKKNTKRNMVHAIVKHPNEDKVLYLRWKAQDWRTFITGGIEEGEDEVAAAAREIREETGYTDFTYLKKLPYKIFAEFYAAHKDVNRAVMANFVYFELKSLARGKIAEEEKARHEAEWIASKDIGSLSPVAEIGHVVEWLEKGDSAYTGEGVLINSGDFNGMESAKARDTIAEELKRRGSGGKSVSYKLRDWIFSRQHYWGEPIPIVYCDEHGEQPVPEDHLPVLLPKVKNYEPTDTGESPLAAISSFVKTKCPVCGKRARRETDTMPNWAGSNWYFIRYTDPRNSRAFADREKMEYWLPVDLYNGGMEHTTLHLLYSRFIYKFLYDCGLVPGPEPYARRTSHGIVLASDGRKMSKSFGNVINPNEIVDEYGADTLRMYEMFLAPFEQMVPWDKRGVVGVSRYLERVYKLAQRPTSENVGKDEAKLINRLVQKITNDIADMRFNTAVSSFMEAANHLEQQPVVSRSTIETYVILLAPFAPHLSEELWSGLGHGSSVHLQAWPSYDEALLVDERVRIPVQVNGKVRDIIEVQSAAGQEEVESRARSSVKVAQHLSGKQIIKTVFVPGKMINFVIRQ